jgi:hypothetical protein
VLALVIEELGTFWFGLFLLLSYWYL